MRLFKEPEEIRIENKTTLGDFLAGFHIGLLNDNTRFRHMLYNRTIGSATSGDEAEFLSSEINPGPFSDGEMRGEVRDSLGTLADVYRNEYYYRLPHNNPIEQNATEYEGMGLKEYTTDRHSSPVEYNTGGPYMSKENEGITRLPDKKFRQNIDGLFSNSPVYRPTEMSPSRSFGSRFLNTWKLEGFSAGRLDRNVYRYYDELSDLSGNSVSDTYGNPVQTADKQKIAYIEPVDGVLSEEGGSEGNSLINKTAQLFRNGSIQTMISRFYNQFDKSKDQLQSGTDTEWGLSRGKNLRRRPGAPIQTIAPSEKGSVFDSYSNNPFCRVWTSIHEYDRFARTIRHGDYLDQNLIDITGFRRRGEGLKHLAENTVLLTESNRVRIAPEYNKETYSLEDLKRDIKKCMFSIENLAWRDIEGQGSLGKTGQPILSPSQIGPNGGRIMWFPPYNLKFSENVNIDWKSNSFIGRGENIYTYSNTDRSGVLSFTLILDYPSIFDAHQFPQGEDEENDELLKRFVAGEDRLEYAKTPETPEDEEKRGLDPEVPVAEPTVDPKEAPEGPVFKCYVFFPNNYSGINDWKDVKEYTPMEYLRYGYANGIYDGKHRGYELDGPGLSVGIDEEEDPSKYIFTAKGIKYWYRVDKEGVLIPIKEANRKDNKTFKLNKDTSVLKQNKTFIKNVGLEEGDNIISFQELFDYLVNNDKTGSQAKALDGLLSGIKDPSSIMVSCKGFASKHGRGTPNKILSNNRGESSKRWISSVTGWSVKRDEAKEYEVPVRNKDINDIEAKLGRFAEITICLPAPKDSDLKDIVDTRSSNSISGMLSPDSKGVNRANQNLPDSGKAANGVSPRGSQGRIGGNSFIYTPPDDYDDEYKYFKKITKEKGFLYNKMIEKIKYFTPAYHSISPEGFNARLTFLHQCTRQGPTRGATEGTGTARMRAGNLAFGRPPYCILRIGDFYNTRILIDSLSIDYADPQWDMNPEGIGVQPMLANITLNFKFLGGSDLAGPIERLQNAVSFNYYSNTSVYDRRADWLTKDGIESNWNQSIPGEDLNRE